MATRAYKRRKSATGTTAIPFLITVLISMLVLGSIGYYFYNKLTVKDTELKPMQGTTTSISDDDVNEILFVLTPSSELRQPAVMLMRFDPIRKDEFCLGIPLTLVIDHEGREMTVGECFQNHGINALKNAVSKALDQEIDRYIQMDSEGFSKLIALIGNVNYVVPIRDDGLRPQSTSQVLDAAQFETLLTSKKYASEQERSAVIGLSVAALLNQCDGQRISANLDGYFSAVINAISTNITSMDYSAHRHAITYMFSNATAPAKGISLIYEQKDDQLLLTSAAIANLKVTFSQSSATT